MLIIFDLDDTLIDTSGCITYHKLEEALHAMVNAGLAIEDFPQSLEVLRRLDSTSSSAKDAVSEFLEMIGAKPYFLEIALNEIYHSSSLGLIIFPLEGVTEVLLELAQQHQLALVSNGKPDLQMEKLKKAGIDSRIFSKIAISEELGKKDRYKTIVEELACSLTQVIVCGDRVSVDLSPARELGFKTVQMQWGRGLNSIEPKCDVDFCINDFRELKDIVSSLTTFSMF